MLARDSVPLSESGDLAAFLGQLDRLPPLGGNLSGSPTGGGVHGNDADTVERQLTSLGLLADKPGEALPASLGVVEWFVLLRGLASRRPDLAVTLAALSTRDRCAAVPPDATGDGWALHAEPLPDGQISLWLPCAPSRHAHWRFLLGTEVRRVAGTLQNAQRQAGGAWLALAQSCAALPCAEADGALSQQRRNDALALVSGVLWQLLDATREHAANRPMFGRRLVDFPTIQLRLLRLHARLLVVEELADAHLGGQGGGQADGDGAGILAQAEAVRIDAQQICGGSGYIAESTFAASLSWLECAMRMLRATLHPGARPPRTAASVWQQALDRLARAGVVLDSGALGTCRMPAYRAAARPAPPGRPQAG